MAMNVERSTCVVLYKFADVFSLDIVRKRCMRSIQRHFAKVASSEEFCSVSVNQLTEIISHDELDVKEETTVWEAVVRWVQHSREDRLHHLPSILPHIRFNLLTSDDTAAILKHPLVRENPGSSSGVVRNVAQKGNSSVNLRQGMETMEMVLLSTEERDELVFMNPREGKYISCNYVPGDLHYGRVMTVTSDNDIYLLSREGDVGIDRSHVQVNHAENGMERSASAHRSPGGSVAGGLPGCGDGEAGRLLQVVGQLIEPSTPGSSSGAGPGTGVWFSQQDDRFGSRFCPSKVAKEAKTGRADLLGKWWLVGDATQGGIGDSNWCFKIQQR
ncbi:kelch repeat and BTB domain-containing protein 8-like [Branchiostoma floridae]|uniref:Kelch repeat and BTB domain-containing protein 8-like n=1 Tax=Branchiostoma floridae TaxID=7739 RepID=A0A9J7MXV8_BRAFL|nr:kelch repeat and BTB domain-containing protein 8-like [Branchiostoma floridae]